MARIRTVDLTRRESQIMEILHRRRRATVEAIRAELPDAPSPSSVRKLLDIMIERGLLTREYDGPRYVYSPAVKAEDARRSALKQLVRTFFDNSPSSAMAALLDMTSTSLSPEDYRRLSGLLKRAREQGDEP
jgi:predicted transcriptional regulator